MSRRKALRANPRRLLAALATILVAVGVTVASGASFTATTANPSNTFTAGSLTMSNDKAGAAILTASGMKPGDATTDATGTVVIKNTGSLTGAFTLSRSSLTNSDGSNPMAAKLNRRSPTAVPTRTAPTRRQHGQVQRPPVRDVLDHLARQLGRRRAAHVQVPRRRSTRPPTTTTRATTPWPASPGTPRRNPDSSYYSLIA